MSRFARRLCLALLLLAGLAGPLRAQGYEDGLTAYEAGQYETARKIWEPVADSGDPDAQYGLGRLYEIGPGEIRRDYVRAAEWYRKAAAQGIASAQNNLGLMYLEGRGVPQDPRKAAVFWRAAVEKDHAIAQYNLGLIHFKGEGVRNDRAEAERLIRGAAESGLGDAQYAMGQIKRMGFSNGASPAEALHWYQLAAAKGHAEAERQAQALRQAGVTAEAPALVAPALVTPGPGSAADPLPLATSMEPAARPSASAAPSIKTGPVVSIPLSREAAAIEMAKPAAPAARLSSDRGPKGRYRVWLGTMRSESRATSVLSETASRFSDVLSQTQGFVAPVDLGEQGVFYRVIAGELPNREAAVTLCRRLRAKAPGTFCKVLEN